MDSLSVDEIQVIVKSLQNTYIDSEEVFSPTELSIASELCEKAKDAYKDALFEDENSDFFTKKYVVKIGFSKDVD